MKKLIFALCLLSVIGCKGKAGQQGERGPAGTPGTFTTYTGTVSNDSQYIYLPALRSNSDMFVLVGDGTGWVEAPYFSTLTGFNTAYWINTTFTGVTMLNAQRNGATTYKITVLNPSNVI